MGSKSGCVKPMAFNFILVSNESDTSICAENGNSFAYTGKLHTHIFIELVQQPFRVEFVKDSGHGTQCGEWSSKGENVFTERESNPHN